MALANYAVRKGRAGRPADSRHSSSSATWPKPFARDRIVGIYRPLQERDAAPAVAALRGVLPKLLADRSDAVGMAALNAVEKLGAKQEGPALFALVSNPQVPAKVRGRALEILAAFGDPQLSKAVEIAVADKNENLRVTGITLLGKLHPDEAATKLGAAFKEAGTPLKKVIITSLGELKSAGADRALAGMIDELIAGKVPAEIQLELLEAAAKRTGPEVKAKLAAYEANLRKDDPLAAFRPTLVGGDHEAGEKLFKEHAVAQCLRCHKVKGQGGDAGPDISGIAAKKEREYILESIILPNAKIAESFQMMLFTMKDGSLHAGLIKKRDQRRCHRAGSRSRRREAEEIGNRIARDGAERHASGDGYAAHQARNPRPRGVRRFLEIRRHSVSHSSPELHDPCGSGLFRQLDFAVGRSEQPETRTWRQSSRLAPGQ